MAADPRVEEISIAIKSSSVRWTTPPREPEYVSMSSAGSSTGVSPDVTTCRGPRTEPAGFSGTTWRGQAIEHRITTLDTGTVLTTAFFLTTGRRALCQRIGRDAFPEKVWEAKLTSNVADLTINSLTKLTFLQ
jgi:hypothetical protein